MYRGNIIRLLFEVKTILNIQKRDINETFKIDGKYNYLTVLPLTFPITEFEYN